MKKKADLIFLIMLFCLNLSNSQNIVEKRSISYWSNLGKIIYLKSDFDSDGGDDFLTDANNENQIIIGEIIEGKVHAKYKSKVFEKINQIEYVDTDQDGIKELYVFDFENKKVYELEIPTLNVINQYLIDINQYDAINYIYYGDINNDGVYMWYAISRYYKSYTLSISDFSIISELPEAFKGKYLVFGNFDKDTLNEILIKKNYSLSILNSQTFAIENEIDEYVEDFKIGDINNDGINEIYLLTSDGFISYDFSKTPAKKSIKINAYRYDAIYLNDFDSDGVDEAILYDHAREENNLIILELDPVMISKSIVHKFNSQNYEGEIVDFTDLFQPGKNNLLFSGDNLYLVDISTGKKISETKGFSNLSVSSYDNFLTTNKKHLIVSEIENGSGEDALYTRLIDFDSSKIKREILPEEISPEQYSPNIDRKILNFKYKNTYKNDLIFVNGNNYCFYNPNNDKIYKRENLYARVYTVSDLDFDGYPEFIQINTGREELTIYTMINKDSWVQKLKVTTSANKMKVFQMDSDKQLEILLFNSPKIQILDPVTGEIEILNTDFSSWSINDLTFFRTSANTSYIAAITNNKLFIYDINSKTTILNKDIEDYSARYIDHIDLKTDSGYNTYLLTFKNELKLYDIEGNLLNSGLPKTKQYSNGSPLIIHNCNDDTKPYVIVSYRNAIVEYKIELAGEFKQFFHITDYYPHNGETVDVNERFFIEFSDIVGINDVTNSISLYYKEDSSKINFAVHSDNDIKFEIKPDSALMENKEIVMKISGNLNSRYNKELDVNYDFLQSLIEEYYEIHFVTKREENKPKISLISDEFSTVYSNAKRLITVQVDNSENSYSPIYKLSSGFIGDSLVNTIPIDNSFNRTEEVFNILINTFDKYPGSYVYQIIAKTYGNISDTIFIPIEIINEKGYPYKRDGVNNLNTFYQKNNNVNSKLKLLWSKPLTDKNSFDKNIVVGEGDYIYFRRAEGTAVDKILYLFKVKISTGEIIWKNQIGRNCTSGNPLIDKGFLYIQIDNIEDGTKLKCYDIQNGSLVWKVSFRNQHAEPFSPLVTDSLLFMSGGKYGGLYCFNRWTGEEKWFNDLGSYVDWTPSIFNNVIYTSADNIITAFDSWTGNKLWDIDLMDNKYFINNSPIIDSINNQLLCLTSDSIIAINLETHKRNWNKPIYYASGHLGLKEGKLFYVNNKKLYKVLSSNGSILDSTLIDSYNYSDILLSGNMLFFSSNQGTFVFDSETLNKRDQVNIKNANISTIDSILFLITKDFVNAYRLEDNCYDYTTYNADICFGTNYTIGNFTYSDSGVYSDTIINNSGCDEVFTLNLNVGEEVVISDTLIVPDNGSHNGSIAISAQGGKEPYKYKWSNNKKTTILTNLSAGNYYLTITDAEGCDFEFNFTIPFYNSVENIYDNFRIFPNIVHLNGNITIQGLNKNNNYYALLWNTYGYKSKMLPIVNSKINIDKNQLPGMYIFLILDNKKNIIHKERIIVVGD